MTKGFTPATIKYATQHKNNTTMNENETNEKKYKLTDETMDHFGVVLHRIEALRNFANVKIGDKGGWIEKEENLSHDGEAWVAHNAKVFDNARVFDNAKVFDNAEVFDDAKVFDNANVSANAKVYGRAEVCDYTYVGGEAFIHGDAKVQGKAEVGGEAVVYGNAKVYGRAFISGNAKIFDSAEVYDNASVSENAKIYGNAKVAGLARIDGSLTVKDNEVILEYNSIENISGIELKKIVSRVNHLGEESFKYEPGAEIDGWKITYLAGYTLMNKWGNVVPTRVDLDISIDYRDKFGEIRNKTQQIRATNVKDAIDVAKQWIKDTKDYYKKIETTDIEEKSEKNDVQHKNNTTMNENVNENETNEKQKSKWDDYDYSKNKMPENVTVEKANVWNKNTPEGRRYFISATIDGEKKTAQLYYNDVSAYFEKDEKGELTKRVTAEMLVAKYFSKEYIQAEEKEDAQVQKDEDTREESSEEKSDEKEKEEKKQDRHFAILTDVLSFVKKSEPWINKQFKEYPEIIKSSRPISPFNAVMLALNSDAKNYKTNEYISFPVAKNEGISVRKNQLGFPINWEDWSKYENKFNREDVIDKKSYDSLPEEEKALYKPQYNKQTYSVFNIDQTLMKQQNADQYEGLIKEKGGLNGEAPVDNPLLRYEEMKTKHPDCIVLSRNGDFYEIFANDAIEASKVLGIEIDTININESVKDIEKISFPHYELDNYMPKLVRAGYRIAICNDNSVEKANGIKEPMSIYDKIDSLTKELISADCNVIQTKLSSRFDKGILSVNVNRDAVEGMNLEAAINNARKTYKAVAAYVNAPERLNVANRSGLLPEDAGKYEKLVQELSVGALMLRQGLPSKLSETNHPLIQYWDRELREDPKLIDRLERDVNNTVEVITKIEAGKSNEINYSLMRGEKPETEFKIREYTITSALNDAADIDSKTLVLVKDPVNKTVDVILPEGASLNMGEDIKGLNKNRILIALSKDGYEGQNVRWYNAGGNFALKQPNEYFKDKEVETVRLKQYELVKINKIDVSEEVDRTAKVEIESVQMIKDDNNKWALYVKPNSDFGDSFVIYPEPQDLKKFFDAVKNKSLDEISHSLGQKYYAIVQRHPELKANFLMPSVNVDIDDLKKRIDYVSIAKSKVKENTAVLWATIDGKKLPPIELDDKQYQRLFLSEDKGTYKLLLAAQLCQDKLQEKVVEDEPQNQKTEEVANEKKAEDIINEKRGFHR